MSHRMIRRATIATLAALVAAVVPALAGTRDAPRRASVTAVNRPDLRPNRDLGQTDDLRWARGETRIKSGGALTLKNRTPGETHNFSIVTSRLVPRTRAAAENCRVCRVINDRHDFSLGPPRIAVVNRGRRGIDRSGDSVAFSGTRRARVTARPGSTLNFICAIHPWMQGKLKVAR